MLELYTDGACLGNPGPGGWAFFLKLPEGKELTKSGFVSATTNNQMELQAVISGLRNVPMGCKDLVVYSDSQYVLKGFTEGYIKAWKANGWKNSKGKPVANLRAWLELSLLSDCIENIKWEWVKGHSGNPYNELCDKLASQQARLGKV